jgi:hypothetical protein
VGRELGEEAMGEVGPAGEVAEDAAGNGEAGAEESGEASVAVGVEEGLGETASVP